MFLSEGVSKCSPCARAHTRTHVHTHTHTHTHTHIAEAVSAPVTVCVCETAALLNLISSFMEFYAIRFWFRELRCDWWKRRMLRCDWLLSPCGGGGCCDAIGCSVPAVGEDAALRLAAQSLRLGKMLEPSSRSAPASSSHRGAQK